MDNSKKSTPSIRRLIFAVLSLWLACIFFVVFYNTYWRWVPLYEVSGHVPILGYIYDDVAIFWIIPVLLCLASAIHFYRQL